jgi:single-stranded-DNA-specific exonuclease
MPSRLSRKWTVLKSNDEEKVKQLAEEINVPLPISGILINRGIKSRSEARKFFVHSLDNLHDPFLMKGMDKASDRIVRAVKNSEEILVFGDYDVDGTSGVAMFHLFLNQHNVPNHVFIPDRFTDGYGLSYSGIEFAKANNIRLMVVIDCGITAVDKVEYAVSSGIDIIICDHHQPPQTVPPAYAVLDPLQTDCNYPFKYLCGTGVAFKLIQAVCFKLGSDRWKDYLDFVSIATAADLVPLIDENRIMTYFGFQSIKENPRPCFKIMMQNAGLDIARITTSNVVFMIGPRINAVGRLGDATRAVKFLVTETEGDASEMVEVLENENSNRKKIDSEIYIKARDDYEKYRQYCSASGQEDIAIILHDPDWHPGVLGIIAARMVEKYYRPSIILTTFNGTAKGSARSINNFNIYEAIRRTSEKCEGVIQFGGHFHAAGVEIKLEYIQEFRIAFNRVVRDMIASSNCGEEILVPEILIDAQLDLKEINERFMKILKHFEPFGPGNMTPVFFTQLLQVVGEPRVYRDSTYVFKVRSQDRKSGVFDCVYYQSPELTDDERIFINTGDIVDIVYSPEENHWNGITRTQLRIKDIKSVS